MSRGAALGRRARVLFVLLLAIPLAPLINAIWGTELSEICARIASGVLELVRVPVVRDGTTIITPLGRFAVIVPCSGAKYLAVTLCLGPAALLAGAAGRFRRFLVLLSLAPVAILGNGIRVAGLILAGGPAYPSPLHVGLGLACFAGIALVIGLGAGCRST